MPDDDSGKAHSLTARFAQAAAVLSALTTALVAYNTWQVSTFEAELRRVESNRELNFRLYASISEALESNDARRIQAVRTIVMTMSPEPLRSGFLDALSAGEESIFDSEQLDVRAPVPTRAASPPAGDDVESWGEWDFDLFWCSVSGVGAQQQAERLEAALRNDGAEGRIRVRVLPESRRADVGAEAFGYEVRGEAGEEAISERLVSLARREVAPDFRFVSIAEGEQPVRTQWYVSAFICPEPPR